MGTVFINRFTQYCGGSQALARLLAANAALSLLLWVAVLVFIFSGTPTISLYSLTSLPSDVTSFSSHPWTLVTYMFTHFDPLHLIFNMLWLYWFGRMLAGTGHVAMITRLYIIGGIAGGVMYLGASLLTAYAPGSFLTGASAAVLAIICAAAMYMPDRRIRLFLLGILKLKWVALICVAFAIISSVGSGIPTQAAHAGGILAGVAYSLIFRLVPEKRPATLRSKQHKEKFRKGKIQATVKAMTDNRPDHERLDQLLDKMRVSGYDSLTAKEKTELNYISSRIEVKTPADNSDN